MFGLTTNRMIEIGVALLLTLAALLFLGLTVWAEEERMRVSGPVEAAAPASGTSAAPRSGVAGPQAHR